MSKETREHISALVDGEISRETSRFLVRRLGSDDELRSTWMRYHLVRDCLRYQDGVRLGEDLCARVGRALENEQPGKPHFSLPTRWLKPVVGTAIAASVALMAVLAVDSGVPVAPQAGGDVASEVQAEQFTSPQSLAPPPVSSQASFSGQADTRGRKMNSYLVRHYQATGATGHKGFVTFVPIVITGMKSPSEVESGDETANLETEKDQEPKLQ